MKKISLVVLICSLINSKGFSQTFTLKSNELSGQATINEVFNGFGCVGKNQSPQLTWENAPAGTKSFAITLYDPDAPTGSGWWHWVMFDIPANISSLASNAGNVALRLAPLGAVQSKTDFGGVGYGGPCPPEGHGIHQYILTIYALKTEKLSLTQDSNPALVGYNLSANVLQKASLVFYFKR